MADREDSLIIEFFKMKATATGRFAVIGMLTFVFLFMAGVAYFGGNVLLDRLTSRETTTSFGK